MNSHTIRVVNDWHKRPFGRYPNHSEYCGKNFREQLLVPNLNIYDHVTVDLTGYNRYGRSFIDEAFGGLIRENGFNESRLKEKLTITHEILPSIVLLAWSRIESAQKEGT
ncbi:STAS-like domain-containing protein [Gilvimarinus sp. 1_MG-2023]|uniref:STAS-like domain-containing protein n=1 Tax=Gilvimarinus sp. 1_MG-2023 TaxID=3062638 RepID=UPI0026E31812|nr:STAS-like domain-containing protein [Gilvimarinus sp. 1_MG-2023]MDO6747176.1 STAS-like domain-containing protein [Gilvimarinus sp. 1_MG-2023]